MELSRILIREREPEQLIELKELEPRNGVHRTIPIVIGIVEAAAIGRRLEGIEPPRPMTHDLLSSVINGLGATLDSIEIVDLQHGAFIANLKLIKDDGNEVRIDARPSDALALGIAQQVRIFAKEDVIELAAVPKPPAPDYDF